MRIIGFLLLALAFPSLAQAGEPDLYKCPGPDGIEILDVPCDHADRPPEYHCQDNEGDWWQKQPCPEGYEYVEPETTAALELAPGVSAREAYHAAQEEAFMQCSEGIEARAGNRFDWTDGILGGQRFPEVDWKDADRGVLRLGGDKLNIRHLGRGWVPCRYVCEYDLDTRRVVALSLEPAT